MATSVKLGVDVSAFKQGIKDAQANVKALGAELKRNEAQFKATGDAEQYLTDKTRLLKMQMTAQKNEISNLEKAMSRMRAAGVDTTSAAYQRMVEQLSKAQTSLLEMGVALNDVAVGEQNAASGADKMASSLSGINKKVSLQQVQSAIGSITRGLEAGAKKALELGQNLMNGVNSVAANADNILTQAMILDMTPEQYQQYKGVFDTVGEITVQEWQKAKLKVQKAINDPTQDQTDILGLLGIRTHEMLGGKNGVVQGAARDFEEVFWDIGETLRRKVESGEMTQDLADTYANAIFGRGFAELKPIFELGKDGFTEALDKQATASEEALKKNAEYADELTKVKASIAALEQELVSGFTPVLTKAAEAIDGMLTKLLEYLKTPEGKQALDDMGKALEGLFTNLGEIEPDKLVEGLAGVFNGIVNGLQWLTENSDKVVEALKAIVLGWAGLKLTGGALKVVELIQGISGLTAGTAAATGAAAGASWGGAFASAVLTAAPWLAGLITLLAPAGSAGNDKDLLYDPKTGQITSAGWASLYNNPEGWGDSLSHVGEIFGDLGRILGDAAAMTQVAKWATGNGDEAGMIKALEALGYVRVQPEPETEYKPAGHADIGPAKTGEQRAHRPQAKRPWEQEVEVEPELPDNAQEILQGALNQMTLQVAIQFNPMLPGGFPMGSIPGRANGLPLVPWDGYPAILHKGEQVVPAREVSNTRNFSSNLYVESMIMNNGADAEGLAAAMAAANRRISAGFGW